MNRDHINANPLNLRTLHEMFDPEAINRPEQRDTFLTRHARKRPLERPFAPRAYLGDDDQIALFKDQIKLEGS